MRNAVVTLALGVGVVALVFNDSAFERRAQEAAAHRRAQEAAELIPRIVEPGVFERIVALNEIEPVLDAAQAGQPSGVRRMACIALGRIGGKQARDRLLAMLQESTGKPENDGWTRLYAAAGLTELADPATAIDLILQLSTINPDDALAARADRMQSGPYFTIDAQLCDALLTMGLHGAAASLIEQLERIHRIRISIDAYAVLRRHTGLDLPFRYNGSDAARLEDAQRWRAAVALERTWDGAPAFDLENPRFRERCKEVVAWLGGSSITHRLKAHKVLDLLGEPALPFLIDLLRSDNRVGQRQAAYTLGLIAHSGAAEALMDALDGTDADARAEAVDALTKLRHEPAVESVRAMLKDPDGEVRAAAATLVGKLGGQAEVMPLVEALKAELERKGHAGTVTAMTGALVMLDRREYIGAMLQIFVEGELVDRRDALRVLEEYTSEKFDADAAAGLEERRAAAERIRERIRKRFQ